MRLARSCCVTPPIAAAFAFESACRRCCCLSLPPAFTSGRATRAPSALVRFLNQRKYPASQLFLLMTLGPTIALLPLAERARGWLAEMLRTFGRVPMFYYLLHIPVIHALALLVWLVRDGSAGAARFATAPYVSIPEEQRWGLALLYLVFAMSIAVLYGPCRWFARLKAEGRHGWLRYI